MRNAHKILVGCPEEKLPLGRSGRGWEDNVKMDLRELGFEGVDWILLDQGRDQWRAVVSTVINPRVP
jgi:hypothetical protein